MWLVGAALADHLIDLIAEQLGNRATLRGGGQFITASVT